MKTTERRQERSEYAMNIALERGCIVREAKVRGWQLRNNVAVHGLTWAVEWATRNGISFDVFYFAMFGKFPKK